MTTETVTLRPATAADAEALAELVVQLYHTEVPGGLRGSRGGQLRLFRYLIDHELASGARGRFLAVDEVGRPVGSVSVRFFSDSPVMSAPPGLFAVALRSVGLLDTLRVVGSMLRGSLVAETTLRRGECFVYSVVVAEELRGRGIGRAMLHQVEHYARQAGMHVALLRVLAGNARGRNLYLNLGYTVVARTPRWVNWIGVPSELLRKELGA